MIKKILILAIILVLFASFVSAITVNKDQTIEQSGHIIEVLDVSKDGSCIFRVDGELVVVEEKQSVKHNGVLIWVKNAYILHSDEDNACEFIVSAGQNKDKTTESYSTLKKITDETTDKINEGVDKVKDAVDVVKDKVDELGVNTTINDSNSTIVDDINNAPIKQTEKSIIRKFIDWFKGLFGVE
jgi:hypothetical protein